MLVLNRKRFKTEVPFRFTLVVSFSSDARMMYEIDRRKSPYAYAIIKSLIFMKTAKTDSSCYST